MTDEQKIIHILRSFGIVSEIQHKFIGFSSATYLVEMNAGTQISSIMRYKLDIANALNVSNVRIAKDLYVHEGKAYLAIESAIRRKENLLWDKKYLNGMKIPLGIDNFENVIYWDLEDHSSPHMLVGGSTGSGKTVYMISILEYAKLIGYERIVVFDPKYKDFKEYHNDPMIEVYNDIDDIEFQIGYLVEEMEEIVKRGGFRRTLIMCDEYADAVANSKKGNALKNFADVEVGCYKDGRPKTKRQCVSTDKSLEGNIQLLLQKSRAIGFNIVLGTQRASVKVISGDIKVNLPIQVSFRVNKEVDSKVMIDESGAEALTGYGDGLIKSPSLLGTVRFQSFYKS